MITGNIDKDSKYRDRILRAVALDRGHPIHHGIAMQAHHVISAKGVSMSGLGPSLKAQGFDINELKNLVLIPCTLQGACHLGVQLHRGNHTYHDDEHPRSYHLEVSDRIKKLENKMDDYCARKKSVQGLLNSQSKKILKAVSDFKLPLTAIFESFKVGNSTGCANATNVGAHNKNISCVLDRNHFSGIARHSYTLRIGR